MKNCEGGKAIFGESCECCMTYSYIGGASTDAKICSSLIEFDTSNLEQWQANKVRFKMKYKKLKKQWALLSYFLSFCFSAYEHDCELKK